ncbi:MAG: hypothetical protein IKF72_08785 [Kiritimatiellae bacterium]|nr:hypothetical protein [Kiritimatiellia bacterium]
MNNSIASRLLPFASLVLLVAGCATEKYGAFEPKPALAPSEPSTFSNYGKAMAHNDGYRMAYEWQRENPQAVADATKPEVLAAFVTSDEAADALLAKIGTSYDGDPLALTQIAAVTQFVMCPKCQKAPARRKVWVAALERTRSGTDDGYVRTFCDQQLRLCK